MRMITRSLSVAALSLVVGAASLSAQSSERGPGRFQWYIGGHGGIVNFQASGQTRGTIPMAGVHTLITARRTGLYLSVEQGFGSNEVAGYDFAVIDSTDGTVSESGTPAFTFDRIMKYSALLVTHPIRGPVTPFVGVGASLLSLGGIEPGTLEEEAGRVSAAATLTALGGVEIRVARFTVFGQYQVTSNFPSQTANERLAGGDRLVLQGRPLRGVTHTLSAGLRVSLGAAAESRAGRSY